MPTPVPLVPLAVRAQRALVGERPWQHARGVSAQLQRVYLAIAVIALAAWVPGWPVYHDLAVLPLAAGLLAFLAALTLPWRTATPALVATVLWTAGTIAVGVAAAIAGFPSAYLWAGVVCTMPSVAMMWPLRLTRIACGICLIVLCAVAATAADEVRREPPVLFVPTLLAVLLGVLTVGLRRVDIAIRREIVTDRLTGLRNRAGLAGDAEKLTAEDQRAREPITLLMLDLDHFKMVNDRHGHTVGDDALRRVAQALRTRLGEDGDIYRFGGEEFVALLPGSDARRGRAIGESLLAAVREVRVGDEPMALSGGVAPIDAGHRLDLGELVQRADGALYQAKRQGRGRLVLADPSRDGHALAPAASPPVPEPLTSVRDGHAYRPHRPRAPARWLVRSPVERDHLHATMDALMDGPTRIGNLVLLGGALLCVPWLGWSLVAVAAVSAVVMDPLVRPAARTWRGLGDLGPLVDAIVAVAAMCAAIALCSKPALYMLPLLAVSVLPVTTGYRPLGAVLIYVIAATGATATALSVDAEAVRQNPLILSMPLGVLGTVVLTSARTAQAAIAHRAAAIVDPLTGVLNRSALETRLTDLDRHRDPASPVPISLLIVDVDRFKDVNDSEGHRAGDAALLEVATRLHSELRFADVLFRIGGEEFVVLLHGVDEAQSRAVAERLRDAIAAAPVGGRELTISVGAATARSGAFEYPKVFDLADSALLEAKRGGRNRVVAARS